MGKFREIAVALGVAKSVEQLQAEHWAAMFRANSPSDADRAKARDELLALAAKSRDENNRALQSTLWKNSKPRVPTESEKQKGEHPSRADATISEVHWPEHSSFLTPRVLRPVYDK